MRFNNRWSVNNRYHKKVIQRSQKEPASGDFAAYSTDLRHLLSGQKKKKIEKVAKEI